MISIFFFSGANGAGKTTTFRMLINDIKPSSGNIIINGKNINELVNYSIDFLGNSNDHFFSVVETRYGNWFLSTI
jgi:ABC-type multidrug transport system ATPase subunit